MRAGACLWAALREHRIHTCTYTGRSDRDIILVPDAGMVVRVHSASSCELGRLLEDVAAKTFSVRLLRLHTSRLLQAKHC